MAKRAALIVGLDIGTYKISAVVAEIGEMGVEIVRPRHRNPPEGEGGPNHWECWMRDPDGYRIELIERGGA